MLSSHSNQDAILEQMELPPLRQMTDEERLVADFHGSGMSTGHPMTYCREALSKLHAKRVCDLPGVPDGQYARVAGCVIARQRPGTAEGFVFFRLRPFLAAPRATRWRASAGS